MDEFGNYWEMGTHSRELYQCGISINPHDPMDKDIDDEIERIMAEIDSDFEEI